MCGIYGWLGIGPDDPIDLTTRQGKLLQHRGPNDQGFEYGSGWGLGFRRLSILDLSPSGHQPMCTPDRRFWIAFNGEIYNYVELRKQLEQEGEAFSSFTDTEVLLKLLARDGSQALTQLNGMFSLALVDTVKRTFLLARDRLGKKPLYYHAHTGHLRFASELKALLAWPDAPKRVDPIAVSQYLVLNYLPNESCIFEGYKKLPPGHFLMGSLDRPERTEPLCYWHLELNDEMGRASFAKSDQEALGELLSDAVRIRLRSDVPVGIFLSGGLDSGLVAAMASQAFEGSPPVAFTVGFINEAFDESELAASVAKKSGLEHRVIYQRASELSQIDYLAWFYDEPFGDSSALPTMALCEAAAKHATVFLAGDGGDEAFGGYRRYIETQRHSWLAGMPSSAMAVLRKVSHLFPQLSSMRYRLIKSGLPDAGFAGAFDTLPNDPVVQFILSEELQPYAQEAGQPLWKQWSKSRGQALITRQQSLDYSLYLPDDILVKVDRASMAQSIEVRSPFLDYRLVEWAARLPRAALLNKYQGKLPLRNLGKVRLPEKVLAEKKRGFGVPLGDWFRQPKGRDFLCDRLLSSEARQRGFWSTDKVQWIITAHQANQGRDFSDMLWRLLMLDAWARQYMDGSRFLQGPPNVYKKF